MYRIGHLDGDEADEAEYTYSEATDEAIEASIDDHPWGIWDDKGALAAIAYGGRLFE